ncbi:MAG: gliding motility-associated-like protein [Saprospiraceae bacterium]|jgi:gliding motility-associated-like protein
MSYFMRVSLILAIYCVALHANSQCAGGKGNNLFEDGDFGTGVSNSLSQDPKIAPGYAYTRTGPPNDGQYIISNDLGQWPGLYGTWLPIEDNSSDPNGYMMVVNASFEPGLFYDETIGNLCENTTFEFSADIINLIRQGVDGHSDPNVDFLIDDVKVLGTGNIPKNERWNTYSFAFETAPGQTSVKLSLRNNAPGGTGNDLALDNITFSACGPISEIFDPQLIGGTHCQEDGTLNLIALLEGVEDTSRSYLWETSQSSTDDWMILENETESQLSLDITEAQEFWVRFAAAGSALNLQNENCRFYSDPIIISIPKRIFEVNDTLCGGLPLPFDEGGLVRPGLFIQPLLSAQGCDSIRMIQLDTIQRATLSADFIASDPTCPGQPSGTIEALNINGGYSPYYIEVNEFEYPGLIAENLMSGYKSVSVKDKFECFYDTSILLNEPPPFTIDLGGDRNIILGEEIEIEAISSLPYMDLIWPSTLSEFNNTSPITVLPIESTSIFVTGITRDGCEASDSINIDVKIEVNIYVPNAFSPNRDGVNDEYYISSFGKSLERLEAFEIYDRWGNLVFESQGVNNGKWNGAVKDLDLQSNIYTYRLVAILINGDMIKKTGSIQILK